MSKLLPQTTFRAGYLPGLSDDEVQWKRLDMGTADAPLCVEVPSLTTVQMTTLANRVKDASRRQLRSMPVSAIVRVLDTAIARLLDSQNTQRHALDHLLPLATGFDAEMGRLTLNSYLQTFRGLQLQRFVAEDFANPKILDEFQPRVQGGWSKAFGPDLLLHVWAGNVAACRFGALSRACWSRQAALARSPAWSPCSPASLRGCWPRSSRARPKMPRIHK